MSFAVAARRPAALSLPPVVLALLVAFALFAVLFRAEVAAAVSVWVESTAYNHCFLVVPVIAVLLWRRRAEVAQLQPTRGWIGLPLLAIAGVLWWIGLRAGLMEARQLGAVAVVEAALLLLLGRRGFLQFGFEFAYLVFAVPFGAFLHAPLQSWTASFIGVGLDVLQIPYWADGLAIDIVEGRFVVEEACSGLRFLIASVAFGALFAHLNFISPWRKLLFLAASVAIPIVMNGFRALGIVLVGHWAGSAEAAEADHVLYGTIFFAMVITVMVLVGQACSDRRRTDPRQAPAALPPASGPSMRLRLVLVAACVLVLLVLHAMPADDLADLAARLAAAKAAPITSSERNFAHAQFEFDLGDSVRVAAATSFGDLRPTGVLAPSLWIVDGAVRSNAPGLQERLRAAMRLRPLRVVILAAGEGIDPASVMAAARRAGLTPG